MVYLHPIIPILNHNLVEDSINSTNNRGSCWDYTQRGTNQHCQWTVRSTTHNHAVALRCVMSLGSENSK
jgi:hypothetical protein